jgi:transcription factor E2F7/8
VSDDEDDDKLADLDGDTDSEKLSQIADNSSDKPGAPQCRLRSGTLLFS